MSSLSMLDYVQETPSLAKNILKDQEQIALQVAVLKKKDIKQIYIIGSGTSCHAGLAIKTVMEKLTKIRVTPMYPNEFIVNETIFEPNTTLVIGVSQSGGSVSTVNALEYAKSLGMHTLALVGMSNTIVEEASDLSIDLKCGPELAVAKTKGYSMTLIMLVLISIHWCEDQDLKTLYEKELNKVIGNLDVVINKASIWVNQLKSKLETAEDIKVIGPAQSVGSIREATLKLLETIRIPVSGYEEEEFMHGIYNATTTKNTLIYLYNKSNVSEKTKKMYEYFNEEKVYQILIGNDVDEHLMDNFKIPTVGFEPYFCIEEIIPFQILAFEVSSLKGIDSTRASDPNFHTRIGSKKL